MRFFRATFNLSADISIPNKFNFEYLLDNSSKRTPVPQPISKTDLKLLKSIILYIYSLNGLVHFN